MKALPHPFSYRQNIYGYYTIFFRSFSRGAPALSLESHKISPMPCSIKHKISPSHRISYERGDLYFCQSRLKRSRA